MKLRVRAARLEQEGHCLEQGRQQGREQEGRCLEQEQQQRQHRSAQAPSVEARIPQTQEEGRAGDEHCQVEWTAPHVAVSIAAGWHRLLETLLIRQHTEVMQLACELAAHAMGCATTGQQDALVTLLCPMLPALPSTGATASSTRYICCVHTTSLQPYLTVRAVCSACSLQHRSLESMHQANP